MQISNWVNYEVRFNGTEEKIRFLPHLERWIRKIKDESLIDSFHVKHHRDPRRVLRIRLIPAGSTRKELVEGLRKCLHEFGDDDIVQRSREVLDEDLSIHDYTRWKILEYNTEILFLLVNAHGIGYKQFVKERYWTEKFDMIHLLLNQLGLPDIENAQEIKKLYLGCKKYFASQGI